jgi:hypothetical protein
MITDLRDLIAAPHHPSLPPFFFFASTRRLLFHAQQSPVQRLRSVDRDRPSCEQCRAGRIPCAPLCMRDLSAATCFSRSWCCLVFKYRTGSIPNFFPVLSTLWIADWIFCARGCGAPVHAFLSDPSC